MPQISTDTSCPGKLHQLKIYPFPNKTFNCNNRQNSVHPFGTNLEVFQKEIKCIVVCVLNCKNQGDVGKISQKIQFEGRSLKTENFESELDFTFLGWAQLQVASTNLIFFAFSAYFVVENGKNWRRPVSRVINDHWSH